MEKDNGRREYEFYSVDYSNWVQRFPLHGLDYGAFEESGFVIFRIAGLKDEECRGLKDMVNVAHKVAKENGLDSPIPEQYRNQL